MERHQINNAPESVPTSNIGAEQKVLIAAEVVKVLVSRFESFQDNETSNRNAPFHLAFLKAFQTRIDGSISQTQLIGPSSWFHGLSTTLGQSFFENVAQILSCGEKRSFTSNQPNNLKIGSRQERAISVIIHDLQNGSHAPNLDTEDALIAPQPVDSDAKIDAEDFTADVYIETDTYIEAIELMSEQHNVRDIRGEKRKVLSAKAALRLANPGKTVGFFFGFPFDPWSHTPTGYDKNNLIAMLIDGSKYLDSKEILVAGELWDRLSGAENTMQQILDMINAIATPEFMNEYAFVNDPNTLYGDPTKSQEILQKWGFPDEVTIIGNYTRIKKKLQQLERKEFILNQRIFNNKVEYNTNRRDALLKLIEPPMSPSQIGMFE